MLREGVLSNAVFFLMVCHACCATFSVMSVADIKFFNVILRPSSSSFKTNFKFCFPLALHDMNWWARGFAFLHFFYLWGMRIYHAASF